MTEHKTLAEALVAAQQEMPVVEKTAKAVYGKYATLDDLIAKTRPVLNKHGLSIQQFPSVGEHGPVLTTIIRHVSGQFEQGETPLILQKQDMQGLGSAITYARRYAWSSALGIASEQDDDAQSVAAEPKAGSSGGTASARSKTSASASAPSAAHKFVPPASVGVKASVDSIAELFKLTEELGAREATELAVEEREEKGTLSQEWVDRCVATAKKNLAAKKAA